MFTFALDHQALFAERSRQFAGWGIPGSVIRRMQARITDCWSEGDGGWSREWMREAESAERKGQLLLASLLYGAARFPCVATPLRQRALERQMLCFEGAVKDIALLHVERRHVVPVGYPDLRMPVHLYAPRRPAVDRPLVLLSGGVDTGKVELHRLACLLAGVGRFRVAAVDMPGTSESGLRLSADAHRVYQGLLGVLAPTGRRAMVGVSFGGHWAAKLALMGGVDAAVNLGGPTVVFESGGDFMRALPNGMPGIIANALGLSSMPDDAEIAALMQPFSLRGLSQHALGGGAAVLTINGDQDQYIPQEDSMLFAGHAHHPVWLMRGMGHCAAEGLVRILPALVAWLRLRMFGETAGARVALSMAQGILPARAVLTRGARR